MVATCSLHEGKQGDGSVIEAWHVALTKLHEGLVGSPLQGVVKVVAPHSGEPSSHCRVGGVSWDDHVDPEAFAPELTVRVAMVCRSPCVTEAVQHIPEQGPKLGMVQPVTTVPSVSSEGGIGLVIHLSKTKEK
jgi:hypothetical protein